MYLLGLIADDVFFFIVFNKVQEEEKKKSDVLSGCRNRRIFVFRICHVTNVVLLFTLLLFCESLS